MSNKTINQALRDLFLGLGGDASELSDNTTISDFIEDLQSAIEDAIANGVASALPSVTASDNGKVLAVNGGKWEAIEPELDCTLNSQLVDDSIGDITLQIGSKYYSTTMETAGACEFLLPNPSTTEEDEYTILFVDEHYQWHYGTIDFENQRIDYVI